MVGWTWNANCNHDRNLHRRHVHLPVLPPVAGESEVCTVTTQRYTSPAVSYPGTYAVSPSAWSFTEQEAFADSVFADLDRFTYTSLCIASVIRRQQRERQRQRYSRALWFAYFKRDLYH
jgi:hypothetical protein